MSFSNSGLNNNIEVEIDEEVQIGEQTFERIIEGDSDYQPEESIDPDFLSMVLHSQK